MDDESAFTWIPFYMELADKLLVFKDDRAKLIALLRTIHAEANIKFPKLEEDGYELSDIDPFTVFGLFNKGITETKRSQILSGLKEKVGVSADVPTEFEGVPRLDNRAGSFYRFQPRRGEHDIDNLWSVFETALDYADTGTNANRDAFVDAYNIVIGQPRIKWNITMGFYWTRPQTYLNLDGRNRWAIAEESMLGNECAEAVLALGDNPPAGEGYLHIRDLCLQQFDKQSCPYAGFPEFSQAAWLNSEEVNARQKEERKRQEKRGTQTMGDEDDETPEEDGVPVAYTKDDFLDEVFMTGEEYDHLKSLLRHKKNVILQGAPGVGKTFIAKRLAYSMMECKDQDRVELVQFHQSYSYEDFIMGYRPCEGGGFKLTNGAFYEFCKKASADTDHDYFFIIDEINRGNLSKIFGELFMLIEADKRNYELRLLYSDEAFSVPANVYLIGMMNTADRSLAMLDYALRRRFAFYELNPGFESDNFRALLDGVDDERFRRLVAHVLQLNEEIESDDSLGRGFRIGHSFFCDVTAENVDSRLDEIVEYELVPLLNEYWFDDFDKAQRWASDLRQAID